jgi:hypothetical protein
MVEIVDRNDTLTAIGAKLDIDAWRAVARQPEKTTALHEQHERENEILCSNKSWGGNDRPLCSHDHAPARRNKRVQRASKTDPDQIGRLLEP